MPNTPLVNDVEHPCHVYESPIFKCMRGFNMTEVAQLGVKWKEILKVWGIRAACVHALVCVRA